MGSWRSVRELPIRARGSRNARERGFFRVWFLLTSREFILCGLAFGLQPVIQIFYCLFFIFYFLFFYFFIFLFFYFFIFLFFIFLFFYFLFFIFFQTVSVKTLQ